MVLRAPSLVTRILLFFVAVEGRKLCDDSHPTQSSCTDSYLNAGQAFIEKCSEGSLCTLVKINADGKSIAPLGRSYDGKDWEAYSVYENSFSCDNSNCTVDLPPINIDEHYKFSECIRANYSRDDELARFLDQATFGVTREDLIGFDSSEPVDVDIARWIKSQMEDVDLTSHREYFRKHAIHHYPDDKFAFRTYRPCEAGSKWRKYAFSPNDNEKDLLVEDFSGQIHLSLDGHLRTVVSSINWSSDSYRSSNGNLRLDKSYEICDRPSPCLNCKVRLRDSKTGSCQEVDIDGGYGNPGIKFDTPPTIAFQLDNYVEPIGDKFFSDQNQQELLVVNELTDPSCQLGSSAFTSDQPIFGYHAEENAYYVHSPPPVILDNTLQHPISDGGGKNSKLTGGETMCSNVNRNFFNEKFCKLSYDGDVCNDEDELEITLNEDSILTFYETTLNDPNYETRYAYAIGGLVIDRKSGTSKPCRMGTAARWIPLNKTTCEPNSLYPESEAFLASLIANSSDTNPIMRDIYTLHNGCNYGDRNQRDFEINVDGTCWKQVHQDHLDVYDMTYWVHNYPGANESWNPIREVAENGEYILQYPSHMTSTEWRAIDDNFRRLGRLGDVISFPWLKSGELEIDSVEEAFKAKRTTKKPAIVCGSEGEIANDPSVGGGVYYGAFDVAYRGRKTSDSVYREARETIMTMIALYSADQLRQRQAWALSQIVTIASPSIENTIVTEARVSYTDILVRNAFKSYRNILKEISFSGLMAENLSYMDSKSTASKYEKTSSVIYPDENFAREVMQLYSIGVCKLNQDGSEVMGVNGVCEPSYTNDEITEYSRAWTGFKKEKERGNIELMYTWEDNLVDPLKIEKDWRDKFPKLGLNSQYIGDGYPLCVDRPKQHFLKKNAKYRLLGSTSTPELLSDPPEWSFNDNAVRFTLEKPAEHEPYLYNKLCNPTNGTCDFKNVIVLDSDLECYMNECDVDTLRVVEVTEGMFYEYVSEPCVEEAFFNDAKKVTKDQSTVSCADPRREVAHAACCAPGDPTSVLNARRKENYWGERVSFDTASQRCQGDGFSVCNFPRIRDCRLQYTNKPDCMADPFYWTSSSCEIKIKIEPVEGNVAIVYSTDDNTLMAKHVMMDTPTFFPVLWENGAYPTPTDGCGGIPLCQELEGMCVCVVNVSETASFESMPSQKDALNKLKVGAFDPTSLGLNESYSSNGVTIYYSDESEKFSTSSVFKVIDDFGRERLLKNIISTVSVGSSAFKFRNPPHFNSLTENEAMDPYYETDAVLDQLFYHDNTAPFISMNLIQRFGISNPSPRYILSVSTAFRTGIYTYNSSTGELFSYGSSIYGDLGATVAAILLDPEAREMVLDLDPTHGSLLEPILKLYKLMRSMEIKANDSKRLIEFYYYDGLTDKIGQEAYDMQSVFGYYLPEFQPSGRIQKASLVSPEAQLLTGPNILGLLNGMFSLAKWGTKACYDGFFNSWSSCSTDPANYKGSDGKLTYSPASNLKSDMIVEELATLLTGGRLNAAHRNTIQKFYDDERQKDKALIMAIQLILTSAEFHTSGSMVQKSDEGRPITPDPTPSSEPYKAVIFLLLAGGFDSFNMLVPACEPLKTMYQTKRDILALSSGEITATITAAEPNDHTCSDFALHHKLPFLHDMYAQNKVIFLANTGALDKQVDKTNYETSVLKLFAHNHMQSHIQRLDPFLSAPNTGILGRMAAVLAESTGTLGNHYQVGSISVSTSSCALRVESSNAPSTTIVGKDGVKKFDPYPWNARSLWGDVDLMPSIIDINNSTTAGSSLYGETWSSSLLKVIDESEFLEAAMSQADITEIFGDDDMSKKLLQVAKLIQVSSNRGVDRDFFFVEFGGWDHHDGMKENIALKFESLNNALKSFWKEMVHQNNEDKVTLVATSDFGRTLTPNSNEGSDHGWGGNYFVMGGDVKGGQILGEYPSDFDGPLVTTRGRVIPTTPWDAVWFGVAQWMGITDSQKLQEVIIDRQTEIQNGEFFNLTTLFKDSGAQSARRSLRKRI